MKTRFRFALFLVFLCTVITVQSQTRPEREKYNFNADWKMAIGDRAGNELLNADDKDWQKVTLPHAFNENDAFKK